MKIAIAGNPNCGKTTLFNAITGASAHVGNWPGVTVDKKVGVYKKLSEKIDVVDLPGIYSLSPYTPEEVVARDFVLDENPDCIINIVDATNLERNLYLTTQLLELDCPVVVALNMMDVVDKSGDKINVKKLEKEIGVPVVEICALRSKGIRELMATAFASAKDKRRGSSPIAESSLKGLLADIIKMYEDKKIENATFHAVKMLEGDELEVAKHADLAAVVEKAKAKIKLDLFADDFEGFVADSRYKFISNHFCKHLKRTRSKFSLTRSDKIDRVLTHRIWGIPIFLILMLLTFHLTFSEDLFHLSALLPEGFSAGIIGDGAIASPGMILFNAMEWFCGVIDGGLRAVMPAGTWYTGLICDGLWGGLSAVLSFVPQILTLFFFLSIMEDTGYMARVAFIMDRAFRKLGLSGKAFMPLLMCFGCAVPGIMATRTLENQKERKRALMLTPFFSCGAKLPIWAAFAGVFATAYSGLNAELVVFSVYLLGIVVAILSSLMLTRKADPADIPPFIMELPAYHAPRLKNVNAQLWEKLKHYVYKVTTILTASIIVIWFLSTFSFSLQMVDDASLSIIGQISQFFTWLFIPLGFGLGENGWKFVVACFTGLIAKEMVVATMGTFAGMDGDAALEMDGSDLASTSLGTIILGIGGTLGGIDIAIPAMYAFMAFNLLSIPCMAATAAVKGELMGGDKEQGRKDFWQTIAFWMGTAYVVSFVIFWFGTLCVVSSVAGIIVGLLLLAGFIAACVVRSKKGNKTLA